MSRNVWVGALRYFLEQLLHVFTKEGWLESGKFIDDATK